MNCQYCGREAVFLSSREFYGKDYGTNLYLCRYCDAYVGTHGRTDKPKGTLANAELRQLRMKAHNLFDPLWKGKRMNRTQAYQLMQKWLDLPKERAHIAMLTKEECLLFIQEVQAYRRSLK